MIVSSVQSPTSKVQHPMSSIQRLALRVQSLGTSVQSPESSIQNPESNVHCPESSIQSPALRVQHPESSVQLLRPESRNSVCHFTKSKLCDRYFDNNLWKIFRTNILDIGTGLVILIVILMVGLWLKSDSLDFQKKLPDLLH